MKSGFVSVLGLPNVGKSSLINKLVKHKICIVTSKPQTTRDQIQAVAHWDKSDTQVVFIDTPGLFDPSRRLGKAMVSRAKKSINEIDLILYMIDASHNFNKKDQKIWESVDLPDEKIIILINKVDLLKGENDLIQLIDKINKFTNIETIVPISVKDNYKIDLLKNLIKNNLEEGPVYYPKDMLTDKDKKFMIKELIRESIIKNVYEELPYVVAIIIKDFSDKYIKATIICEKESQNGILIGSGGSMIKKIGKESRKKIENFLDKNVYLELVVNVKKNWRKDERILRELGYID